LKASVGSATIRQFNSARPAKGRKTINLCRGAALARRSLRAATVSDVVKNKSKHKLARSLKPEPAASEDNFGWPGASLKA